MGMTTQDLITLYHGERSEAKLGQQLFNIPCKEEFVREQVFYYYTDSRLKAAVDFTKEICFSLKYLKYKGMTPQQYRDLQESSTRMEKLIEDNLILPFALFVSGRFIPWENIRVIISHEYSYLLIHDLDPIFFDEINGPDGMVESVHTVVLPDDIVYRQGYYDINEKTIFSFDEYGRFNTATSGTGYINIDCYENDVEFFNVEPAIPLFTFTNDLSYKYFEENIFVFKDGNIIYPKIDILGTAIQLDDETSTPLSGYYVRVVHNTKLVTKTYDSVGKLDFDYVKDDLINYISGASSRYLNYIADSFDPALSRYKSYSQNRSEFLNYLATYDLLLFNKVYISNKDYITLEVDGAWMIAHQDDEGRFRIPRQFQDGNPFYIIVFVNGLVYKYYRNHFYDVRYFYCPISEVKATDVVEIMYFKNAKNYELSGVVDHYDTYEKYDPYYYDNNTKIFCPDLRAPMFRYPKSGIESFPVGFSYEYDSEDPKKFRVRYDSSYYYGRDIKVTNRKRFVYNSYEVSGIDDDKVYFKVDLGDKFRYCTETNKFVVFLNGFRMIQDMYCFVLPYDPETPFYKAVLYLCEPLKNGDLVEVFYLPTSMVDLYGDRAPMTLSRTGVINIDKSLLKYPLDKDLVTVWLNSRKIPDSQIKNISSDKIMITGDIDTTIDIRVATMISDEDLDLEYVNLFQNTESDWDKAMSVVRNPEKYLGYSAPNIAHPDTPVDSFSIEFSTNGIDKVTVDFTKTGDSPGLEGVTAIVNLEDGDSITIEGEELDPIYSSDLEGSSVIIDYLSSIMKYVSAQTFIDSIPRYMILKEIIRDWYMSNEYIDATGPFFYKFENPGDEILTGHDSAGNAILDVMDANDPDNIDTKRYWY